MHTGAVRILLSLFAFSLMIAGCKSPEKEPEPLVSVQVAEVKPVDLIETVTVDAVLFPIKQAAITPKISAPVKEFHVQRGAKVKQGQLLATLENRDLSAAVTENKGGYEQAEATYATATKAGIPEEMQKAELDVQQSRE